GVVRWLGERLRLRVSRGLGGDFASDHRRWSEYRFLCWHRWGTSDERSHKQNNEGNFGVQQLAVAGRELALRLHTDDLLHGIIVGGVEEGVSVIDGIGV